MLTGLRVRTLPAVALLALLAPLTACGGDDSSVADPGGGSGASEETSEAAGDATPCDGETTDLLARSVTRAC